MRRNEQQRCQKHVQQPKHLLFLKQDDSPVHCLHWPYCAKTGRTVNAREESVVIFSMMVFRWNNDDVSYASLLNTAARNASVLEEAQIPRRKNTGRNIELVN